MFLKAGALSLVLLLASRLLGLARESAQAAAFGATSLADVAVVVLSLPDWIAGVVAGGALAYVMLPAWASMQSAQVETSGKRLAWTLALAGGAIAGALAFAQGAVIDALIPGLPTNLRAPAAAGLLWALAAVPAALLAALGAAYLQHKGDYVGMYGANLVANGAVIAVLVTAGALVLERPESTVYVLGTGVAMAMVLRLAWLFWRQRAVAPLNGGMEVPAARLPGISVWAWALLATGLPLALPFAARSFASDSGEGALAIFNYAWKLVELPQQLAIQLVAAVAFAPIAAALAATCPPSEAAGGAIRPAFALAWTLACAAVAGLLWASVPAARILFGWGRMDAVSVVVVGEWGRVAAWGLLPQSVTAVALIVLAARRAMHYVACAYALVLVALLTAGLAGVREGRSLMLVLDVAFACVALVAVAALGRTVLSWIPWRAFGAAGAVLLLCQAVLSSGWISPGSELRQWVLAGGWALGVLGAAWLASPDLRRALAR